MKRKSKIKTVLLWVLLLGLTAGLAVLPAVARERTKETSNAVLLSARAERGEITGTLSGGGTLTAEDSQDITVPAGVELTEYLVADGDHVTEGTPVAAVDKVTAMAAAVKVQETLDTLAEKIRDASNDKATATLTAAAPGRVKALYVKSGDDVREAMLTYGCLAVISLDGQMSVEIAPETALSPGESVRVRVAGGKTYTGRVETFLEGKAVVTLTDDGPKLGAEAEVTDSSGNMLGIGKLEVHSPLRVIAESGTVNKVLTKIEAKLAKGANLLSLKNMDASAEYESLASQRREYSELLQELFALYRDGVVKAPGDGYVIGIDETLVKELSASGDDGYRVVLLADGSLQTFEFFIQGTVQEKTDTGCKIDADSIEFSKVLDVLLGLSDTLEQSIYIELKDVENYVWAVNDSSVAITTTTEGGTQASFDMVNDNDPCTAYYKVNLLSQTITPQRLDITVREPQPVQTPQPTPAPRPSQSPMPSVSPGAGGASGFNGMGGFSGKIGGFGGAGAGAGGAQTATPEPEELYDLTETVVGSLVPDNGMKVSFAVDELDILKYSEGMEAEVTVDALPGRTFAGTVTEIGAIGTSGGGNSKYTVTVAFDRTGDMLEGMNASVEVRTGKVSGVVLPVAALHDSGSRTYVYTSLDKEGKEPEGLTEVTVGVSDGENAQILSGLEDGQTVWYIYYSEESRQQFPTLP